MKLGIWIASLVHLTRKVYSVGDPRQIPINEHN
jgi:hypothetical protein